MYIMKIKIVLFYFCWQAQLHYQSKQSQRWNHFWLFWRVREIGLPFLAEDSCQGDAFPGQNGAFTFDLTNVERWPRNNFLDYFQHFRIITFWFIALFYFWTQGGIFFRASTGPFLETNRGINANFLSLMVFGQPNPNMLTKIFYRC